VVPSPWLANVKLEGDKLAAGDATPVPDNEMLRAVPGLVIDMCPGTLPLTSGANTTVKVVLPRGPRAMGNTSPLMLKPAPVNVACESVTLRFPSLVSFSLREWLVPTVTLPKLRLLGLAAIWVNAIASFARPRATKNRSTERTRWPERLAHGDFRGFSR